MIICVGSVNLYLNNLVLLYLICLQIFRYLIICHLQLYRALERASVKLVNACSHLLFNETSYNNNLLPQFIHTYINENEIQLRFIKAFLCVFFFCSEGIVLLEDLQALAIRRKTRKKRMFEY